MKQEFASLCNKEVDSLKKTKRTYKNIEKIMNHNRAMPLL